MFIKDASQLAPPKPPSTLDLLTGDFAIAAAASMTLDSSGAAALPVIRYPNDAWARMMGTAEAQALLVRPDGIVTGEFSCS